MYIANLWKRQIAIFKDLWAFVLHNVCILQHIIFQLRQGWCLYHTAQN